MSRSVSAPSSVTKTSPCWNGFIVPGIDVEVRVELLHGHPQAAGPEQVTEARGREPLAEGGGDASGDEDVLGRGGRRLHHGLQRYQPRSPGTARGRAARREQPGVERRHLRQRVLRGRQGARPRRRRLPERGEGPGSPSRPSIAPARAAASPGGTSRAASPVTSRVPPASVATTAAPARSASWTTRGCPSHRLGTTTTSAAPSRSGTSRRTPSNRSGPSRSARLERPVAGARRRRRHRSVRLRRRPRGAGPPRRARRAPSAGRAARRSPAALRRWAHRARRGPARGSGWPGGWAAPAPGRGRRPWHRERAGR